MDEEWEENVAQMSLKEKSCNNTGTNEGFRSYSNRSRGNQNNYSESRPRKMYDDGASNYGNSSRGQYGNQSRGNYVNRSRGNYVNRSRGNYGNDSRGNYGNDSRGNYVNRSRGNYGNDSRGNYGNDSRGNYGNDSRGNYGNRSYGSQSNNDSFGNQYKGNSSSNKSWPTNDSQDPDNKQNVEEEPYVYDPEVTKREHIQFQKDKVASLPKLEKNFYKESEKVKNLTDQQVAELRKQHNDITVSYVKEEGAIGMFSKRLALPKILTSFTDAFEIHPEILKLLKNFTEPTPIQRQGWPALLSGQDFIGIAQTGTGKTLTFLLPGIIHIKANRSEQNRDYPQMLVMAPTRELAQQIHRECEKFVTPDIRTVCVYGQGDIQNMKSRIEEGVDVVVATPGKLLEFSRKKILNLEYVSYFVLDEADRMLDLGFMPDIMILEMHVRPDRQVVMTSATWMSDVQHVANKIMGDPIMVKVGTLDLTAVDTITQDIWVCEDNEKMELYKKFIESRKPGEKTLVFANTRNKVIELNLATQCDYKLNSESFYGGKECDQSARESALEYFRNGEVDILISTNLGSRGLDVDGVTHVLNYDIPRDMEEYVHRCGRTGRAGKSGEVLSFVSWHDKSCVRELIKILERGEQNVPEKLRSMEKRYSRIVEEKRSTNRFNRY